MVTAQMVNELRTMTGAGMMDCKKALTETNGDMDAAVEYLRDKGIAKAAKKAGRIAAEGLANVYISGNKAAIIEVNSETDFVSKNENFVAMVDEIGNAIVKSDVTNLEDALKIATSEGTVEELIVARTATIGEKLSLRRIEVRTKTDEEVFGSYLHMGGKIAVLTVVKGANEEVARDVAMQAAAMKPEYLNEESVPADRVEKEKKIPAHSFKIATTKLNTVVIIIILFSFILFHSIIRFYILLFIIPQLFKKYLKKQIFL